MTDPDRSRGLYDKYRVDKIVHTVTMVCPASPDGLHHKTVQHWCQYCPGPEYDIEFVDPGPVFVLDYSNDPHAAVALAAYAKSCEHDYPVLADDLRKLLRGKPECECDEPACQWCEIHGATGNPPPRDLWSEDEDEDI